jgi:O-succinylbenzoate synthase
MSAEGLLQLSWRPYRFVLPRRLITSRGALVERSGWLLRLATADGALGWGEAAAPLLRPDQPALAEALARLPPALSRQELEQRIPQLPAPLACAAGMALAELDGAVGAWRAAPASAQLLPSGQAALAALDALPPAAAAPGAPALTLKWKVAAAGDGLERQLLEQLLQRMPATARLRLDANGGWDLLTAGRWAERLAAEPRLEWLEQPLAPAEMSALRELAARLPVALDESLPLLDLHQRLAWPGWLVRRPLQEGDPRPLLTALQAGVTRQMISTSFETGIGRRFVAHLAALQADGPTPAAPGFAPGWCPAGELFAADPERVWESAAGA